MALVALLHLSTPGSVTGAEIKAWVRGCVTVRVGVLELGHMS